MVLFCLLAFFVIFVIGLVGGVRRRTKQFKLWFILSAAFLVITVISSYTDSTEDALTQTVTVTAIDADWVKQVMEIANKNVKETEKFDEVSSCSIL